MSSIAGGIANKIGNCYEYNYVITKIIDVIYGKIKRFCYEPPTNNNIGTDIEITNNDEKIERHQCKSSIGNNDKWIYSKIDIILKKWKDSIINDENKYCIVSPFTYSEFENLIYCAKMNAELIFDSEKKEEIFCKICQTLALDYTKNEHKKIAIKCLSRIEFIQKPESSIKEYIIKDLGYLFEEEPERIYEFLLNYIINKENFGKKICLSDIDLLLKQNNIEYKDLSKNNELPKIIEKINKNFVNNFHSATRDIVNRKEVNSIFNNVEKDESIILYGKPGVGKSGICINLIKECQRRKIPCIAVKLDLNKPFDNLIEWGKSLSLPDSISRCIDAVSNGTRAIIILDQLDFFRYTKENSKIAISILNQLIEDVKYVNSKRNNKISIIFATREYDYRNDVVIVDINTKNFKEVEIQKLDNVVVKSIIGESYDLLSKNLKELLRVFNNIYIYQKIIDKTKKYETVNDLIKEWENEICNNSINNSTDSSKVKDFVKLLFNKLKEKQEIYINIREIDTNFQNETYKFLLHEGYIIENDNNIRFEHQSILDYYYTDQYINMLYNGNTVDDILQDFEEIDLNTRYILVLVLTNIFNNDSKKFIEISEYILKMKNIRFYIKTAVFEVLALGCDESNFEIIGYVCKSINDKKWRKYIIETVLPYRKEYIFKLLQNGSLEKLINSKQFAKSVIQAICSISDRLSDDLVDFIDRHLFINEGLIENWRVCFYGDISKDSENFFDLRLKFYEKYPNNLELIDLKQLSTSNSKRIIDIIFLMFKLDNRKREQYLYSLCLDDLVLKEDFYNENYEYILEKMLHLLPVDDKEYNVLFSNWNGSLHSGIYSHNLERLVINIINNANRALIKKNPEKIFEIYENNFNGICSVYNEVILKAFINLDNNFANKIVEIICCNFNTLIFSKTSEKDDSLYLFKELLKKISVSCDDEHFKMIEDKIVLYKDVETEKIKKEEIKNKIISNRCYDDYLQWELLPLLDKNRISDSTKNKIHECNNKIKTNNRFKGIQFNFGNVVSPVNGKNISIDEWIRIITLKNEENKPMKWDEKNKLFIDSSPNQLSRDFQEFIEKEFHSCLRKICKIDEDISLVYISSLVNAFNNQKTFDESDIDNICVIYEKYYDKMNKYDQCTIIETIIEKRLYLHKKEYRDFIFNKMFFSGNDDVKISKAIDYNMVQYNVPQCCAIRGYLNILINNKEQCDEKIIQKLLNIDDKNVKFSLIPIFHYCLANLKQNKYSDTLFNTLNENILFCGYGRMKNLLICLYDINKFKTIKLLLRMIKCNDEYINEVAASFLLYLKFYRNNNIITVILLFYKNSKFQDTLLRYFVLFLDEIKGEKVFKNVLNYIKKYINRLNASDILYVNLINKKYLNIENDKKIFINLLSNKYFSIVFRDFVDFINENKLSVEKYAEIVIKTYKSYSNSKFFKDDYYISKLALSQLTNIINNRKRMFECNMKRFYYKAINLYDSIIKKNSMYCRLLFDIKNN